MGDFQLQHGSVVAGEKGLEHFKTTALERAMDSRLGMRRLVTIKTMFDILNSVFDNVLC